MAAMRIWWILGPAEQDLFEDERERQLGGSVGRERNRQVELNDIGSPVVLARNEVGSRRHCVSKPGERPGERRASKFRDERNIPCSRDTGRPLNCADMV